MADPSTCQPLIPDSIHEAHHKIKSHIHKTPLLTSTAINSIASSSNPSAYLSENPPPFDKSPTARSNGGGNNSNSNGIESSNGHDSSSGAPRFRLWFKCENFQKIGAFKARGAFHAVIRLIETLGIDEVRRRGVVTHSSGNHAQALALAASHFSIPAYIVMPTISTPSKIAGTRIYTSNVIFSGSTSQEREAVVAEVIEEKNAILVPPYDHPDIILGQGTTGLEMDLQFREALEESPDEGNGMISNEVNISRERAFDAVIAPLGGGGLLSGIATYFSSSSSTLVFGAEPSFQGGDDGRRGLLAGKRIEHVKTLTIADGLRTPVGVTNWSVVSDRKKVEGVYSVTEEEIKHAVRFVFERMKLVVEPSGCVPLAVVLFNQEFRDMVMERQRADRKGVWDVGVVFSGGNTTMKALSALFEGEGEEASADQDEEKEKEREKGVIGLDGTKEVEDVAG